MKPFKIFLFLNLMLTPLCEASVQEVKPFVLVSIPKSGTYLAERLFELMPSREYSGVFEMVDTLNRNFRNPTLRFEYLKNIFKEGKYLAIHIHQFNWFMDRNSKSQSFVIILQIRDLRDVLVSSIYHAWEEIESAYGPSTFQQKLELFFEEKFSGNFIFDYAPAVKSCLELMQQANVIVSRFEELVGEKGGGDAKKQFALIHEIAKGIGVDLSSSKIEQISDSLFGGTKTFRKGQIGAWKTHFTSNDLVRFNEKYGDFQLALGYSLT